MEQLRLELIALGDHEGFAGEVQGLIGQMKDGLPDGLEQAYSEMKAASIQINVDVDQIWANGSDYAKCCYFIKQRFQRISWR